MKRRMSLSRFAGVVSAGVAAVFALAAPQLAEAGKSHMLQKPEQFVMLKYGFLPGATGCAVADYGFAEVFPDGTSASTPFVIPEGNVLVVTDLDWRVSGTMTQGRQALFGIYLLPTFTRVFNSGTTITADLDTSDVWWGNSALTTGFRVRSGTTFCPGAQTDFLFGGSGLDVTNVNLRGYLIKSK